MGKVPFWWASSNAESAKWNMINVGQPNPGPRRDGPPYANPQPLSRNGDAQEKKDHQVDYDVYFINLDSIREVVIKLDEFNHDI